MRGKDILPTLAKELNSLNEAAEALTPPAVSAYDAAGLGDREVNRFVTRFQNLLHGASVNLVKRFAQLPEGAGTYIGWLNDLMADAEAAERDEPWELVCGSAPEALGRLKVLMEVLRSLAGDAHERQAPPVSTWAKLGKRAQRGNAMRLVGAAVKAVADQQLNRRKAAIEREVRRKGLQVTLHVRENAASVLPWPPFEVLALVPADDIAQAVVVLDESVEALRGIVDTTTRLTVAPFVDGIAVAALGSSGYDTLYPDSRTVSAWLEHLHMEGFQSESGKTLGQVLEVAAQLGAMDSIGLGLADRPSPEIAVRTRLERSLGEYQAQLAVQLERFDRKLGERIVDLVTTVRAGEVDYMTEVQDGLGGVSSPTLEEAGYLTLRLLEEERAEGKGS